jgi:hypothetical protein
MKLLIIITISLLTLSSCVTIYFTEPQPKGGERILKVPKELYGKWFSETEGWKIDESGLTLIDVKIDSVLNTVDTTYKTSSLSESLRMYKEKELYILNSRDNRNYWDVIILNRLDNGDINIYRPTDPTLFNDDKKLKLKEAVFLINGEERTVQSLDPIYKDSSKFQSALFSGQMDTETLRKIVKKDNLILIFKNDGSAYVPEDKGGKKKY